MKNKSRQHNIISFSGRKESGKTELANICVENGYEKRSFATALKKLVCSLLNLQSIDELNSYKNKSIGKTVDDVMITILEQETGFDREYLIDKCKAITEYSTGRDWLQVIGTDIIREKDPDWHVRKTFATMDDEKKYVIDDTRFPNELKALKEMGAQCWFIIRNKTDNISNHPSENSLSYLDFDYMVIVNNGTLEDFRKKWKCYLEYGDITEAMRNWLLSALFINPHTQMNDVNMGKLFVYRQFPDFNKSIKIPDEIVENDDHNGFIGDGGDPFVMESWKKYYKKEV